MDIETVLSVYELSYMLRVVTLAQNHLQTSGCRAGLQMNIAVVTTRDGRSFLEKLCLLK